uniref:Uncharacterized protein n=1 Tax=Rhizophora mucronata TaxID=61149 RepID=A0A2P2Q4Q9_RHIMU
MILLLLLGFLPICIFQLFELWMH